jgi:predicted flap endonuclease-1-like 5' DNA nuclease
VKRQGSGKKKYWLGPLLFMFVVIGVLLLASGRLRGCHPFLARKDHSAFLPISPSETFEPTDDGSASVPTRTKSPNLGQVGSMDPVYTEKLRARGLRTTDDLLLAGATPRGRQELAEATRISDDLILRWVNQADLFRINGIGRDYAQLLEAAGVDTVPELAGRRPDNLSRDMAKVNEERELVRRVPSRSQVAAWIDTAKSLPRLLVY